MHQNSWAKGACRLATTSPFDLETVVCVMCDPQNILSTQNWRYYIIDNLPLSLAHINSHVFKTEGFLL